MEIILAKDSFFAQGITYFVSALDNADVQITEQHVIITTNKLTQLSGMNPFKETRLTATTMLEA